MKKSIGVAVLTITAGCVAFLPVPAWESKADYTKTKELLNRMGVSGQMREDVLSLISPEMEKKIKDAHPGEPRVPPRELFLIPSYKSSLDPSAPR